MCQVIDEANEYMMEGKWDELFILMEENFIECIDCPNCGQKHSLLHAVCKHNPPLFVVKEIVSMSRDSCFEADCTGKLPLHIAVEHVAGFDVIIFLINQNKVAASVCDDNGCFPIHLLFKKLKEKSTIYGSSRSSSVYLPNFGRLVRYLCRVSPEIITLEDGDGVSPIEYAIEEEVDTTILSHLQRLSQTATRMTYAA